MNTQYRTTSLLRAVLFFFILFMTAGRSAQAACADHVKRNAGTDLSDTRHGRHGREDEILRIDISVNCEWDDEGRLVIRTGEGVSRVNSGEVSLKL